MKTVRRLMGRAFLPLRKKPLPISSLKQHLLRDELVDEEISPGYALNKFYPAKAGEILDNRYQILVKVGWGVSSTIWFARDMRGYRWESESVVALKITNSNSHLDYSECEIEEHIASRDSSHRGRALFRTCSEYFEISSPRGRHLCLVYEPMREPIWIFQKRFRDKIIPLPLIKTYIRFLLIGLDYLHTACKVVHTDLKLDNIMVTFEDPVVLSDFMDYQLTNPMQYKVDPTGRLVYRSHNDFGPLRKVRNIPKIVDFGMSMKLDSQHDRGIYPIQPDHYRAPEVILGCGWNTSADIWNLGVLLWDLIQGKELFQNIHDEQGHYDAKRHLAEMIALLGQPPRKLLSRYHSMANDTWPESIKRENGKICETSEQYFSGPFFLQDGQFLHNSLIPDQTLPDTVFILDEDEKEKFLSFVKGMLAWLPEERMTAGDLVEHPFLQLK